MVLTRTITCLFFSCRGYNTSVILKKVSGIKQANLCKRGDKFLDKCICLLLFTQQRSVFMTQKSTTPYIYIRNEQLSKAANDRPALKLWCPMLQAFEQEDVYMQRKWADFSQLTKMQLILRSLESSGKLMKKNSRYNIFFCDIFNVALIVSLAFVILPL